MENNKPIDSNNYTFSVYNDDSQINVSDVQVENSTSEAIKTYTCKIVNSLKNSLNYCINTEKIANESILDLCAQNEQLNRIKRDLNESHDKMTTTEKLVDRYVSALGWISSTMKWNNSVKLDIKEPDAKFNEIGSKSTPACNCTSNDSCCKNLPTNNGPIGDLFNQTTQGLSSFLTSMKSNRTKTDLISDMIVHQNGELEKINSSALSLKERVSTMNKALRD